MIGRSVNDLPPSLVARNVASEGVTSKNSLSAARPAQNPVEGQDKVSRWPTPAGNGSIAND